MSDLGNKAVMAENINYYMAVNGKTRSDICNALHIKYTTFTDWVNGKTYPRIDKIEMLAKYFGISKADLVEKRKPVQSMTEEEQRKYAEILRLYEAASPEKQDAALAAFLAVLKTGR